MTLQEIKESKKDVLTPEDIAEVLDQDPQCLRINLREHPDWFEFPKYRKSEKRFVFSAARIFEMDGGERR